ncbi:MAG: hypothetical protein FJ005_04610 [Chloroflexi bacterium]|nr:hypothetical protein [Chloroflexota bacterium]
MELQKINEALNTYIRPGAFPVAVKMTSSASEVPEKARMPKRDLGVTMAVCQGIAIARRLGWLMAMGKEDMLCPPGALGLGLVPAKEKFLDGSFNVPFWLKSQDMRAKMNRNLPRLEYGKYSHVVMAPLHRADFEPQVIIVYGNPAQISRLIQSAVYATAEPIVSSSAGGFACGGEITVPILTDKCQVIITGGGDRAIAQADDHEVAFAAPMSKVEALVEGLEATHKAGMRYPTPAFLMYQAQFPPAFAEFMDYLKQGD